MSTKTEIQKDAPRIETPLDIAKNNFNYWNEILQTGNPEAVALLYAEDASFLPTVETIKHGREGAAEYFVHFLKKKPFGSIIEDIVQKVGDDTILHSGLYKFEVGSKEERCIVNARFTFLWNKTDDAWEIIHHHSSVQPQ